LVVSGKHTDDEVVDVVLGEHLDEPPQNSSSQPATAVRGKNRENMTGRTNGWKQILNALTVHYGDRITNINR
jgi:hypothetical protein